MKRTRSIIPCAPERFSRVILGTAPFAHRELWIHSLAKHPGGSPLLNFTFVFSVLALTTAGLISAIWGVVFASFSLVLAGFLIALLGAALCGWSHAAQLV